MQSGIERVTPNPFGKKVKHMKSILTGMLTGLALWMAASSAMAKNTTYLDLKATGTARPGYPITLTATLSGGPFVLLDPWFKGRGMITIYDGTSAIASIQPSLTNSPGGYTKKDTIYSNRGPAASGIWALSNLTVVSINYTLPAGVAPRNFVAQFDSRKDELAKSSTSPTITIQPKYPSIAPALHMILDGN